MKSIDIIRMTLGTLAQDGLFSLKRLFWVYINLLREPLKMSTFPFIVQVEPTTYCNLECLMCSNPDSSRIKKHMNFSEFKKIVDGIPNLKKINLVGAGEPLMNPELFKMVSYVKNRGILVGFATNAMFLNEFNSRKIIESGADWLNISIDSSDKERYEALRKGAGFELLMENLERFMKIRGKASVPDVSVWFVIMPGNLEDLPGVIKLSKALGISKVSAQLEHNWGDSRIRGRMLDRYSESFYPKVKAILKKASSVALKSGVSFNFVNVPDPKSRRACKWPWKSSYITVEGFVTPCCLQGSNFNKINFGNIFSESFSSIWNNKAYQDFRKDLRSKEPPSICVDCTAYPRMMRL